MELNLAVLTESYQYNIRVMEEEKSWKYFAF